MVTGSPIRVISTSFCMRLFRYTMIELLSCSSTCSNALEISSASHSFGVPITYGVPNFSWSTFAARSPTTDATKLTFAASAICRVSNASPIAQVEKTFQPYLCRFSFRSSTFFCGPKSNGVTPNKFTLRPNLFSFSSKFKFCVFSVNRFAISSSAIPAPYT